MLIRNAKIAGYSALVDVRLMHGAVREIGVSLTKGLYEAETDLGGDELRPWRGEGLPRSMLRRARETADDRIVPGSPEPLMRYDAQGRLVGAIDQHSAD